MTTAILGGVFDPPHLGHVALAEGALRELGVDRLLVLVAARPGHKGVVADPQTRLELAELALGHLGEVRLDDHAHTIDLLRDEPFEDGVFLLGADEWAAFDTWKESDEVRRRVRIAVAARPGAPEPHGGDVAVFEIEQRPIASREIRARAAAGASIDELVPPAVAAAIERRGLYRPGSPSTRRG